MNYRPDPQDGFTAADEAEHNAYFDAYDRPDIMNKGKVKMSSMLQQAANDYGFDSIYDMIEAASMDSVVPGICKCGYTTDVEPDGRGWCEECNKPSCISVLLLAGIV